MKYKTNSPHSKGLGSIGELEESGFEHNMTLTSTPIKSNERRSISLLDISNIQMLKNDKITSSVETLGSTSSICKDSGYNQSEGSLVSDKNKDDTFAVDFRLEYFRLLDDLKFKDVLISSLHESNHNLRMKIAEAENKICELRLKSQSHCRCCAHQAPCDSLQYNSTERLNTLKYSISTFAKSEPCLYIASPTKADKHAICSSPSQHGEPSNLPSDDVLNKVKLWQNSVENLKECHKRLISHGSPSPTSSNISPEDTPKTYIRQPPEPLPKTMSYMETSRALAETYRRRKEKFGDLVSFQVIGDHTVSVAPVHLQGNQISNFNQFMNDFDKNSSSKKESPMEGSDILPGKQNVVNNLIVRNQAHKTQTYDSGIRRSNIDITLASPKADISNKLLECLREAREFSTSLSSGLSRISAPKEIRSFLETVLFSSDEQFAVGLAYVFFLIAFLCCTFAYIF